MDRRLTVLETRFDTILPTLATKADMAGLRLDLNEKMSSLRLDLSEKMSGLRLELNEKMDKVSSDLHTASTNTIKWCVGIAMTPIVTIVGNGLYVRTQVNNLSAPQPPVSPAAPGPDRSAASPTRTVPEAPPQPRTAPKPG
ncbi:hypothetical protein BN2497_11197 [Janthinobacterium sp. CG23_2]|nr:hypothetical protein BN2497_11197 [Janthinobacterium sp. CG23_2]CUU31996.1 hypothetical protein BN3177_11197 [Janthinobacterium sp. CG23_2]